MNEKALIRGLRCTVQADSLPCPSLLVAFAIRLVVTIIVDAIPIQVDFARFGAPQMVPDRDLLFGCTLAIAGYRRPSGRLAIVVGRSRAIILMLAAAHTEQDHQHTHEQGAQ